jgi:DNA-binding XRE family transcriptional regulator
MSNPQIIRTPAGEELVVLPRAEYDAMVAALEDAAEDEADARIGAERLAEIAAGAGMMTPDESGNVLVRMGYLRAARNARGLTQAQVAETVGIAQGFLSDIEAGRRNGSPETMKRLAEALGLPAEQFVAPTELS